MNVKLLNEPLTEADGCVRMIAAVEQRLARTEKLLTHNRLDREAYLSTIADALTLRSVRDELQAIYNARFNR